MMLIVPTLAEVARMPPAPTVRTPLEPVPSRFRVLNERMVGLPAEPTLSRTSPYWVLSPM